MAVNLAEHAKLATDPLKRAILQEMLQQSIISQGTLDQLTLMGQTKWGGSQMGGLPIGMGFPQIGGMGGGADNWTLPPPPPPADLVKQTMESQHVLVNPACRGVVEYTDHGTAPSSDDIHHLSADCGECGWSQHFTWAARLNAPKTNPVKPVDPVDELLADMDGEMPEWTKVKAQTPKAKVGMFK